MLEQICSPAIVFIIFCFVQVMFDVLRGAYNTAVFKAIVMVSGGFALNVLCQRDLTIVSWMFVFIPLIFMSVIVAILLYTFGLDPKTGTLNTSCETNDPAIDEDPNEINEPKDEYLIWHGNVIYPNSTA